MLVLGLGLGFVMQVLILAVQNAVPYAQLGIATSSATLFRSIGGSLGTAILGAIFSNRLAHELASQLPPGSAAGSNLASGQINPAQVSSLPPALHDGFVHSFTDSLSTVFVIAAAVVAVAFLLAWRWRSVRCARRSRIATSVTPFRRRRTRTRSARSRAS